MAKCRLSGYFPAWESYITQQGRKNCWVSKKVSRSEPKRVSVLVQTEDREKKTGAAKMWFLCKIQFPFRKSKRKCSMTNINGVMALFIDPTQFPFQSRAFLPLWRPFCVSSMPYGYFLYSVSDSLWGTFKMMIVTSGMRFDVGLEGPWGLIPL